MRLEKHMKSWWQRFPHPAVIGRLILSRCCLDLQVLEPVKVFKIESELKLDPTGDQSSKL